MTRRRGYTLVELCVGLALAALIMLLGGRLLLGVLESARLEAEQRDMQRALRTTLERLADDLAAQPRHDAWPVPLRVVDLDAPGSMLALHVVVAGGAVEAVAWLRLADGELWRVRADAGSTLAAAPGNAAAERAQQALQAGSGFPRGPELPGAELICRGVLELHSLRNPRTALDAAQVQLSVLAPAAAAKWPEGTPFTGETAAKLAPGRVFHAARVVLPP